MFIKVSRQLLVLHGFTQYDVEFLRSLEDPSLNGIEGDFLQLCQKVYYRALSFAVKYQGLNVTGHLSSVLVQLVVVHSLVALSVWQLFFGISVT